ncbi:tetraspanin-33-like [Ornithodoros turicata]|uniref:tetraspanin-33-like n=1 Tax=Ornithodoros turicata TaxID=34597 RepID=UPI00313934D4
MSLRGDVHSPRPRTITVPGVPFQQRGIDAQRTRGPTIRHPAVTTDNLHYEQAAAFPGHGIRSGPPQVLAPTSNPGAPEGTSSLLSEHRVLDQNDLSSTVILGMNPMYVLPLEICNCLFMGVSAVIFCLAFYVLLAKESTETSSRTYVIMVLMHLDIVVLILSAIVFAIAATGLIGCVRQHVTLLNVYSVLLLVAIVVLCLLTVAVATLPNVARSYFKKHVTEDYIVNYRESADFKKGVDELQMGFKCCGLTEKSYQDWNDNPYFHCSENNPSVDRCSVPDSCCRRENRTVKRLCGRSVLLLMRKDAIEVVYDVGCADAVYDYVSGNMFTIVCVLIIFNLMLILMYNMSSKLSSDIRELSHIYDHYYAALYEGQKHMARHHPSLFEVKEGGRKELHGPGRYYNDPIRPGGHITLLPAQHQVAVRPSSVPGSGPAAQVAIHRRQP